MSLFSPKTRGPRRFDYEPRYYNPEKEQKLRKRMEIGRKVRRRRSPLGLLYFVGLLAFVLYLYFSI